MGTLGRSSRYSRHGSRAKMGAATGLQDESQSVSIPGLLRQKAIGGGGVTVREAFVHGWGVIDSPKQANLAPTEWQDIRSAINRKRPELLAYCLGCNDAVFVRAASSTKQKPHFVHYGGGRTCPWGPDSVRQNEHIRAEIFKGNQESDVHRRMCEVALELVQADTRYIPGSGAVDKYLKSTEGRHGRWPDVIFELAGLGKFALEVQHAPSLAPEVVGRSEFYLAEQRRLIWLLPWYTFEQIERAFASDIGHEARGNFFVLDANAVTASRERRTLLLWASWKDDQGALHKRLVSLDDLTYLPNRHPYLIDVVTPALFKEAENRRKRLATDLLQTKGWSYPRPRLLFDQEGQPDEDSERLIRVAMSIWSAAKGDFQNFLNNPTNPTSLFDSYLNSNDGRRRGLVIEKMLRRTRAGDAASPSVWKKIADLDAQNQTDQSDRWVSYVASLFPEVFRDDLRIIAEARDPVPQWARGSHEV